MRGVDQDDIARKLAPVEAEVRKRLGNFILGEDDQKLEGVVLDALAARGGSLAVVETFTGGQIAARLAHLPGAEKVFRRGLVARDPAEIAAALGLDGALISGEMSRETAEAVARAARAETRASHALAVLIEVDDGPDRIDFGGSIHLAIAAEEGVESRRSRIYGGREWVRLGAVELGLDCLRRYLQGLPIDERSDFERGVSRKDNPHTGWRRRFGFRSGAGRQGPASRCRAHLLQLTDQLCPAVEHRQDLVGAFRRQADIDSHRTEIAEALQLVGVFRRAADVTGSDCGSRPASAAPSGGSAACIPRDRRCWRSGTSRRRSGPRAAPPTGRRRRE